MKSRVITLKDLTKCLTASIFFMGLAVHTSAQGSGGAPPGAGPPPITSIKREEHSRQASEARLRSAEMEAGEAAENRKRVLVAIANMKEDFTRIQVLRNDIARNLVAHKPLDYSLITNQTGEINKRAHRLNVYMLAHAPEDKEQNSAAELKSEEMIGSLVRLCKLIDRFTENPALKNAATINAKDTEKAKEDKAKADADLLAIIKLSENLHKKSDNLKAP